MGRKWRYQYSVDLIVGVSALPLGKIEQFEKTTVLEIKCHENFSSKFHRISML
jgi:hypothetical protein